MSAPDTNIEKQKHRHRSMGYGVWLGIAIAVLVAVALIVTASVIGTDPSDVIPSDPASAG